MFDSCVCFVGSGFCDELLTRTEESYRVFMCVCVCVCLDLCDLETSTTRRSRPWAVAPQTKYSTELVHICA